MILCMRIIVVFLYVGSSAVPNANILTTLWGAKFVDSKGDNINYFGVYTLTACLPLSIFYDSDSFGHYEAAFYDITPGISDPSVFIPRPECLNL